MAPKKTKDKKYIIMGVIGILFSLAGMSVSNPFVFLILGLLPLISIVLFIVTEHPAAGITYTVLFALNRINVFFSDDATLLACIIIIGLLIYFGLVDYYSLIDWKERKSYNRTDEEI